MYSQEVVHFHSISNLMPCYSASPTIFLPIWFVAGYGLGIGSALLGPNAAMACIVFIERVIFEHYNDQLRLLHEFDSTRADADARGRADAGVDRDGAGARDRVGPSLNLNNLKLLIRRHRDEENEHEHIANSNLNSSNNSIFYQCMSHIITTGCKIAIQLSTKI
jgi:ubiquinone biosynthesis monooxygenase Coq7